MVQIVPTFTHSAFLFAVPYITRINPNIVLNTSISVESKAFITGNAYSVVSQYLAIVAGVHTFGSHQSKTRDATFAGRLGLTAVDSALAFSVLQHCSKPAFRAKIIISGIGGQTGRTVLETAAVAVERVGRLAEETLISGAV